MGLLTTLSHITNHPLCRSNKTAAVMRFVRWQIRSRLISRPYIMPWVNGSRLSVSRGLTGATANLYCGMFEYQEMALLLHALRPDDLFIDVGANIGVFSVLAGSAIGSRVLAFEPTPLTHRLLLDNIRLNAMESRVQAVQCAVGAREGMVTFTTGHGEMNHVAVEVDRNDSTTEVRVVTLDSMTADAQPVVLKIDVEGYETEVLAGGAACLSKESLLAVILELNKSGRRYGHEDTDVHAHMLAHGFQPCSYAPDKRQLEFTADRSDASRNTMYVRNPDRLRERLRTAPKFTLADCRQF